MRTSRTSRTSRASSFSSFSSFFPVSAMRSTTLRALVLVLHSVFPFSRRHLRAALVAVLLAATLVAGLNAPAAYGMGISHLGPKTAVSSPGKPNLFDPRSHTKSVTHPGFGKGTSAHTPAGPPQSLKRFAGITMQQGYLALQPSHGAKFVGSDGKFEIDVPANVVTNADLAAAGGSIGLHITQIAPAAGSSAGGSSIVSFGTYLLQAVDAQGILLPHGLRLPITLKLHYGSRDSAFDLSHAFVVFNTPLPDATDLVPLTTASSSTVPRHVGVVSDETSVVTPTMANSHFGANASQNATLDTKSRTLSVGLSLSDPSGSMSWNTDTPVATFGKPDPFNVDLSAGSLSSSYSIDVPSGPGGLTPPVTLSYSSASVSEQHSPQGANGWVGQGWNLDLGSISWAEHNSNANCTSGCGNGWEDTWQLSDPFGTSVELLPPNINVTTYYDDTGRSFTASPIRWHATPDNYAKVYSYTSGVTLPDGGGIHPPCFRVWLTNGIMEEFGCTADSLEFYYSGTHDFVSNWNLDLITDAQGNQIHITYTQDVEPKSGHNYVRDAVLHTIEWDSPSCDNAQAMCTGSAWAPLMQVNFSAGHAPTRLTNTPPSGTCNTGTNMRCDDPKDLSGSSGLGAPDVQSTWVLNDAYVQVRSSGTGAWNTLNDYQMSYALEGPNTISDPSTGKSESTAGFLLLTKMTVIGADGATAQPTRNFGYFATAQYYEDDTYHPSTSAGCGPAWNTGHGGGCLLWSTTYANNAYYLSTADNGLGLHQLFTWANARDNVHDVNGGGSNNADPLYCNGLSAAQQATYPCNEADDANWSHVVLTQEEGDVYRAASTGNAMVKSITQYAYHLSWPLPAKECSDCDVGMYWGNQNNGDYLDYYDGKFMGFAEADVSNPDGSVVTHKYLATEGYGLYDATVPCLSNNTCYVAPWSDIGNVAHGHEYETDYYAVDGTTLLKEDTTQYKAICPPSGVSASPSWSTTLKGSPYTYTWDGNLVAEQDHGNPVVDCAVQTASTDSYTFDGASITGQFTSVPHSSTSYLYDSLGRVTDQTHGADTGLKADYYKDTSLTSSSLVFSRLDATVNNVWGAGTPFPTLPANSFSVRWTGYIEPQYSETYTFYTNSDDGVRLWVNGTELVNNWTNHSPTENSGTIALTGGQLYPITLEYYEATGSATMQFSWSSASQPKQIIPATALFTRADGGGGSAMDSVPATVTHSDYTQNDAITATSTGATGTYLLDFPLDAISENGSHTTRYSCAFTSYDGLGWSPGQQSGLTLGEVDANVKYTDCGTPANGWAVSGLIETTYTYDTYGNRLTTNDPDANVGIAGHKGCTVGGSTYSTCSNIDGTFHTLTTSTLNALNQSELTTYATSTAAAANGFGLWPISTTDKNGQTTTYGYDALGRMTGRTLPGEANSPTTSWSYTDFCAATGAQTPCLEIDQTQRLDNSNTITSRAFYDGYGNLVETRDPAPNGKDIVRYRDYDESGRDVFDSISYLVTAYTGSPGAAAFSVPDKTQSGAVTTYDGMDRVTSVEDALQHTTTTTYAIECGRVSDAACYEMPYVIDPLGHETQTFTDALGRETYSRTFTGNSANTYAVYTTSEYTYDGNGNLTKITQPNGSATTFTYDPANRKTGMTDPDRGTETYTYDADGNRTKSVDARGGAGTVYAGYDGIDRALWRNTSNSSSGAYVTYSYDSTIVPGGALTAHNYGIGHLTGETFTGGPNNTLSGSYDHVYDMRGQQTISNETVGGTKYTVSTTYDDSGNTLTQTYPDGETVTNGYTAQGWLAQVTTSAGNTTLLSAADYSGIGGAGHLMTGAYLGNSTYHYSTSYDTLLRLTNVALTRQSDGATLFGQSRSFDASSNLTTLTTTLAQGTDTQAFCYDEQNRVTWAGSTGTAPCGVAYTPGTLTAANYTQSFGYDTLGRLTSGPLGSYIYGDAAHLHAATKIGSGSGAYTAAYDAAGDMTCRAPNGSTTCSGTPTGATLGYNTEGQLTSWQNAPSSPSSTDAYLYDGEGNRVEQQGTTGLPGSPTTTTTVYLGNVEEIATSGSSTTTTTYYYAGQQRIALAVSGSFSYLATDALGSSTVALNPSGTPTATTLYAPYGGVRYSTGTMPTDYGYTGQHSDAAATGLDYFNARYYDPLAEQFTSADTAMDGFNRYAYVKGNPTTKTDPSGHSLYNGDDADAAPKESPPPPPPSWVDQGPNIQDHWGDNPLSHDVVFDERTFQGDLFKSFNLPGARTPEDNKETDDAAVLANYFQLSVIIQDRNDKGPSKGDYLVGILQLWVLPRQWVMEYPTSMDMKYPDVNTGESGIDKYVRKSVSNGQAPVIVIDMSRNKWLQQQYSDGQLSAFGDYLTNSNRNITVPKRVIFIYNGQVVDDTWSRNPWGPAPGGMVA